MKTKKSCQKAVKRILRVEIQSSVVLMNNYIFNKFKGSVILQISLNLKLTYKVY